MANNSALADAQVIEAQEKARLLIMTADLCERVLEDNARLRRECERLQSENDWLTQVVKEALRDAA